MMEKNSRATTLTVAPNMSEALAPMAAVPILISENVVMG